MPKLLPYARVLAMEALRDRDQSLTTFQSALLEAAMQAAGGNVYEMLNEHNEALITLTLREIRENATTLKVHEVAMIAALGLHDECVIESHSFLRTGFRRIA